MVEPYNKQVNAAERALRTFKNHIIAGLCTTNKIFLIQLWDRLIKQAEDTLNMPRAARENPPLSAEAYLHGSFDFNKTPLAPPGIKAVVYNAPENRTLYSTHGTEAWYIGPAKDHYQCYKFYNPTTRDTRISGSVQFFPTHCDPPHIPPANARVIAAYDLLQALKSNAHKLDPSHLHTIALKQMAQIFMEKSVYEHPKLPTVKPRVTKEKPRVTTEKTEGEQVHTPFVYSATSIYLYKPNKLCICLQN